MLTTIFVFFLWQPKHCLRENIILNEKWVVFNLVYFVFKFEKFWSLLLYTFCSLWCLLSKQEDESTRLTCNHRREKNCINFWIHWGWRLEEETENELIIEKIIVAHNHTTDSRSCYIQTCLFSLQKFALNVSSYQRTLGVNLKKSKNVSLNFFINTNLQFKIDECFSQYKIFSSKSKNVSLNFFINTNHQFKIDYFFKKCTGVIILCINKFLLSENFFLFLWHFEF